MRASPIDFHVLGDLLLTLLKWSKPIILGRPPSILGIFGIFAQQLPPRQNQVNGIFYRDSIYRFTVQCVGYEGETTENFEGNSGPDGCCNWPRSGR